MKIPAVIFFSSTIPLIAMKNLKKYSAPKREMASVRVLKNTARRISFVERGFSLAPIKK